MTLTRHHPLPHPVRRTRARGLARAALLLRTVLLGTVLLAVVLAGSSTAAAGTAPPPAPQPAAQPAPQPVAAVERGSWSWPVGPPNRTVRAFEAPASPYATGHRGVDLAAAAGTPARSPADGVVTFVGVVVDRPVLSIQHDDALLSSVEPVTASVREGERVRAGQVVGVVATGAHCSDRCLHLGVRRHGQYISPMLVLDGLARAVLLPVPAGRAAPDPAG